MPRQTLRERRRPGASLFVAGALALGAGSAAACRCLEPGPGAAYRAATAVVQGHVAGIRGDAEGPGGATVRIEVSRAWKLPVAGPIEVATSTTCAYVFEAGKDYLVYLQRDAAGHWQTRRCRGNLPLAEAQGRLDWLSRHGKTVTPAASR